MNNEHIARLDQMLIKLEQIELEMTFIISGIKNHQSELAVGGIR